MASDDETGAKKDAVSSGVTADNQRTWLLCPHRRHTALTGTPSPDACSAVFSKITYKKY